jgi:hypothetical protein
VTYKINAFEDVVCAKEGCGKPINQKSELFNGLAIELKKKFKKRENLTLTHKDSNKKPCQVPDCEGIVEIDPNSVIAMCNKCQSKYCPKCMYEVHDGECANFHVQFLENSYQFR